MDPFLARKAAPFLLVKAEDAETDQARQVKTRTYNWDQLGQIRVLNYVVLSLLARHKDTIHARRVFSLEVIQAPVWRLEVWHDEVVDENRHVLKT